MKIGIDIRNIGKKRTGDEVVFFNLAKNLALIDKKNGYVLCTDTADPVVLNDIKARLGIQNKPNFKIVPLPTKNKFTWNFWTLPKYLRSHPVDIYLTQYITPLFVPKNIKIATIIHDVSFKVYRQFIKFSDLFFLDFLIPFSLKRANKIITVSQFTCDEILKYYKVEPEKIDWIHNAVGDNFKKEVSQEETEAVRKKFDLPEKFILYIGTLQPRKNLPALIEAYAKLPEESRTEYKLVLAGGRGYNYDTLIDKVITEYSLQNSVIFTGFVGEEDKPALFKAAHAFCNPSLYEGFGITVLEAMNLGVPTVASDIPPHREVAGESISFFNPKRNENLTENINDVLINEALRQELRQKELQQAKKFSWQASAEKLLEILENA